jgi:DNA-binding beta-propeller fold protein YncE
MGLSTRFVLTFAAWVLVARVVLAADLLLVINKGDNTLAIIDAATLNLLGTAPTGPDPHEVIASADGKLAYITNYNAGNGFANSVSVVDLVARTALPPMTLKEITRVNVGGGAAGIQMSADGGRAFAAVGSRNGVAIIDVKTLQMSGFIATGPGPDGLAWVVGR